LSSIDHIYFALNDAICNSLSREIIIFLNNQHRSIDTIVRQVLFKFESDFIIGKNSKQEFFNSATSIFNLDITSDELENAILSQIFPTHGINQVLSELQTHFSLTLFSQYPPELLLQISSILNLNKYFSKNNIFYTCEIEFAGQPGDFFQNLISIGKIQPGKSIWVDSNSKMTSSSIRAGIDAIIFQNSDKLRREIALRGLLPRLGNE